MAESAATNGADSLTSNESAVVDETHRTDDDRRIPLESLISAEQQEALGAAEMTPERREILRKALWSAYISGFTAASNARGAPTAMQTNIVGAFNGWDGQTIVKLLNGEIWHQTTYYYEYHFSVNPGVRFYQSNGGWKMQVDGTQGSAGVERLK
jgi:hypothetical protein